MIVTSQNITEQMLNSIANEILQGVIENRFTLVFMLNYKHIRDILHWGYTFITNTKGVQPIESIETHLKREFWAEVKEFDISIDERIKAAKGLYFMAYVAWLKNVNK
jgi:hypothetical protein